MYMNIYVQISSLKIMSQTLNPAPNLNAYWFEMVNGNELGIRRFIIESKYELELTPEVTK